MNSREKTFLLGGLGAGILIAVLGVGAFAWHDREHGAVAPTSALTATSESTPASDPTPSLQLTQDEISAAGVQLATVTTAKLTTDVDSFGRVEMPESQLSTISARVGGRIDRLDLQYTGESIRRGQPVASIYSPDAASSVEEYLLAMRSREQLANATKEAQRETDDLVAASRRRLELWDISQKQAEAALDKGDVHITLYSPTSGVVVERKVARGQYVNAGDTLFTVADLSTIWVKADVYESQMPMIHPGQPVEITSEALPNKTLHGRVELIEPQANPQTRTVPVHVHLSNPGMRLVPGMFVRALFASSSPKQSVVVPQSAVINTGTRSLVYVAHDNGAFEARDVELGALAGDLYPVISGLKPGEKVVTNGNFLIDSQTRLSNGMTGLFGGSKQFGSTPPANAPAATSTRLTLSVDPTTPTGGSDARFHATLTGNDGKPITGATVTVTVVMPAMPSMSMPEMRNSFPLAASSDGSYSGKGTIPMAGSWNVTVDAIRNGQTVATYRTRLSAK